MGQAKGMVQSFVRSLRTTGVKMVGRSRAELIIEGGWRMYASANSERLFLGCVNAEFCNPFFSLFRDLQSPLSGEKKCANTSLLADFLMKFSRTCQSLHRFAETCENFREILTEKVRMHGPF